ncbi:MAG: sulfotransferase [Candidatus Competibacteraceae bacterium]
MSHGFVVASPRSGTTFLMQSLAALRWFLAKSGELFPPHFPHLYTASASAEQRALLEHALFFQLETCLRYRQNGRLDAVVELLRGHLGLTEFTHAIRHRRKLNGVVFKEPFLAFAPDLLLRTDPNSRIVYLTRDGRDSADSMVRSFGALADRQLETTHSVEVMLGRRVGLLIVPWWVENGREQDFLEASPYLRNVWMWKEMNRRCIASFFQTDVEASQRVLWVRYEDLMLQPKLTGQRIVTHLGGEWNANLERRFQNASVKSVGIHKRRDSKEISAATTLAAEELNRLGYLNKSVNATAG